MSRVRRAWTYRPGRPALLVLLACLLYVGLVLRARGWDPGAFVDYDGFYSYFIARWGFNVEATAPLMDKVAYRYQRILYPLLARLLAFGRVELVPWALLAVNLAAIALGTWACEQLLTAQGASGWYALVYGLYGSQLVGLRYSLNEPLSQGLVLLAMLAWARQRHGWGVAAFALAILAKETAVLFLGAYGLYHLLRRDWRRAAGLAAAVAPYLIYQLILVIWLGESGVGATEPFSWLPFGGFLMAARVSLAGFLLVSIAIVPMSVVPMVFGIAFSLRSLRQRLLHPYVLALLANSVFLLFMPFETFREASAMVRVTQGLMVSMLLYGALVNSGRILNYSVLWIATNVLLVYGTGR